MRLVDIKKSRLPVDLVWNGELFMNHRRAQHPLEIAISYCMYPVSFQSLRFAFTGADVNNALSLWLLIPSLQRGSSFKNHMKKEHMKLITDVHIQYFCSTPTLRVGGGGLVGCTKAIYCFFLNLGSKSYLAKRLVHSSVCLDIFEKFKTENNCTLYQ